MGLSSPAPNVLFWGDHVRVSAKWEEQLNEGARSMGSRFYMRER
jgi:hypothetical protein